MIKLNKYYISGFPPHGSDDTKIVLFDNDTFGSQNALRLAEPIQDINGVIQGSLDAIWRGNTLQLVLLSKEYTHQNIEIKRQNLGFYHTIRLKEETNSNLPTTHKWPVQSEEWYKKSIKLSLEAYRKAKHTNLISKILYWTLTIGSPILGLFLGGSFGFAAGIIVTSIIILLNKYADGSTKGI